MGERDRAMGDGRRGAGGRRVAAGCELALLRQRRAWRVQEPCAPEDKQCGGP